MENRKHVFWNAEKVQILSWKLKETYFQMKVFRISYCRVDRKLKYWARKPESGKKIAATMVGYYYSESVFVAYRLDYIL